MELKEGMYARTKSGLISKIEEVRDWVIFIEDSDLPFRDKELKASYNIIDLIEVGDYVNGYYVTTGSKSGGCSLGSIYIAEIDGLGLHKKLYEKDIKSIVTKEQFESMSYKVGE